MECELELLIKWKSHDCLMVCVEHGQTDLYKDRWNVREGLGGHVLSPGLSHFLLTWLAAGQNRDAFVDPREKWTFNILQSTFVFTQQDQVC